MTNPCVIFLNCRMAVYFGIKFVIFDCFPNDNRKKYMKREEIFFTLQNL